MNRKYDQCKLHDMVGDMVRDRKRNCVICVQIVQIYIDLNIIIFPKQTLDTKRQHVSKPYIHTQSLFYVISLSLSLSLSFNCQKALQK